MLCHKHEVSILLFTSDPDFDNKCLFSEVRDRNGIWKAIYLYRVHLHGAKCAYWLTEPWKLGQDNESVTDRNFVT